MRRALFFAACSMSSMPYLTVAFKSVLTLVQFLFMIGDGQLMGAERTAARVTLERSHESSMQRLATVGAARVVLKTEAMARRVKEVFMLTVE